ncbi:hypothetical protein PUR30_00165, partial [Streptomyces sp. JV190]|nr:hypothetical protein [Streptomyces sp. JV190]
GKVVLGGLGLGLSRVEIREGYLGFLDFSGINEMGELITVPLRRYSSGLAARLRFSIAAAKNQTGPHRANTASPA